MRKEAYIKAFRKHLTVFRKHFAHLFRNLILESPIQIYDPAPQKTFQDLCEQFRMHCKHFAIAGNIVANFCKHFSSPVDILQHKFKNPRKLWRTQRIPLQIAKHEIKFCKPRFANLQTPCEFLQTFSYSRTSAKLMDMLWLYLVNEISKVFMPDVLKNHLLMNTFTEISTKNCNNKLQKQNYFFLNIHFKISQA